MNDSPTRACSIFNVVTVLVAALLGAAAGFLGVRQSVAGQLKQQHQQFLEERALKTVQRRADVYSAFLKTANNFAVAASDIVTLPNVCSSVGVCRVTPELVGRDQFATYQSARFDYQGALNDVYVYGSDRAVELARAVAATLPPSLVPPGDKGLEVEPIDLSALRVAYQNFLTVMCQEATAQPRGNC